LSVESMFIYFQDGSPISEVRVLLDNIQTEFEVDN
jgi:hypothetical protein